MRFAVSRSAAPHELEIFANLRDRKDSDHFIAESEKIVARLLRSNLEIGSLYLTEEHFNSKKDLIQAHIQQSECNIFIASKEEMAEIVGFKLHQGILGAGKTPKEKRLDELITGSNHPLLFVILDEVADTENIGAIFRTSLAMNATAIIIDNKSVNPWMRRAVRVSMGAIFELPVVTVESIPDCINELRSKNVTAHATTLKDSAEPIWNCDLTNDCALVFGSEGHGIKAEIIECCNKEVTIPMSDSLHSLNVGIAHGIFLYEVMRQRGKSER